jgi:regulator of sigma E protease
MSIFVAIAGLTFLILIHEAGHFFVARAVRMRPRRFYIFFPPALVKRVRNGIEYGIGAIPLGGYVKIPGMHRPAARDLADQLVPALAEAPWLARALEPVEEALAQERLGDARERMSDLRAAIERAPLTERARRSAERAVTDVDDALSPDAYWRAAAWRKIAVIFAGPATNLVFAVGLLALVFALGVPDRVTRSVARVAPGTPASEAGLRAGDRIVAVNGEDVTPATIPDAIDATEGEPVTLTVARPSGTVALEPVRPDRVEGDDYRLGFELDVAYRSYGPLDSIRLGIEDTWRVTRLTGEALGRIVTGSGRDEISSPVGIVQGSSEALEFDYRVYLRILAFISLSLALLNLLPLLPLDGGHIAFSLLEALRGRAIPRAAYERASAIGIALVLVLFFIGLSNDVDRLNGG